jgi:hypothetical protein
MAMQTDVLSTHLNGDGVAVTGPCRVKGYQIAPGGTAGEITFYDNASAASGVKRLVVDMTANTAIISTLIPGEGIKFYDGVYVDFATSGAITVFYG